MKFKILKFKQSLNLQFPVVMLKLNLEATKITNSMQVIEHFINFHNIVLKFQLRSSHNKFVSTVSVIHISMELRCDRRNTKKRKFLIRRTSNFLFVNALVHAQNYQLTAIHADHVT